MGGSEWVAQLIENNKFCLIVAHEQIHVSNHFQSITGNPDLF